MYAASPAPARTAACAAHPSTPRVVCVLCRACSGCLPRGRGDKLLVVDFTATWCGPCKLISTFLSDYAESADVWAAKVDVDKNSETAEAFGIHSVPTFQFYTSGKLLMQFAGADERKLLNTIMELK